MYQETYSVYRVYLLTSDEQFISGIYIIAFGAAIGGLGTSFS